MYMNFILMTLFFCVAVNATQIVKIDKVRGSFQLNFEDVYELPIYPDIETMLSFPAGYTVTLVMPGSPDYISAHVVQNTIYLTRPVDHQVETNVGVHVVTPEGVEEKLVIRCVGPARGTKVLAVNFTRPNTSEINRVVETMKARYTDQLAAELSHQEKFLKKSIHDKTLSDTRYIFIDAARRQRRKEYKGAQVFLDGMINSQDNTYIYLVSTVQNASCSIVSLEKVMAGNAKVDPQLISVQKLNEHEFLQCWSIPALQIPLKRQKVKFLIKIWSKLHTLSASIS